MAMTQRERNELDRYITGNYGEDSVAQEGVLSPECEAALSEHDWYSQSDRHSNSMAEIRGEEGEFIARVSKTISADDLKALIAWGVAQYESGKRVGRMELQHQLRSLLNAAPNELDGAA